MRSPGSPSDSIGCRMGTTDTALDADWLGLCQRSVEGLAELLAATPTTVERARETGTRGSGGDRTLEIDSSAEAVVFEELTGRRYGASHPSTARSGPAPPLSAPAPASSDRQLRRSRGAPDRGTSPQQHSPLAASHSRRALRSRRSSSTEDRSVRERSNGSRWHRWAVGSRARFGCPCVGNLSDHRRPAVARADVVGSTGAGERVYLVEVR